MSTSSKDQLFRLIKTLTKAEKRHFRLFANRTMGQQERKFLRLFDVMDRMDSYDEDELIARLSGSERSHLSHLKRHLYRQLLISLRLIHIQRNIDIEIREQLDFARVLYSKGLYMESLKILERCRATAEDNHQDILQLEILDFQKNIEARHITRSRQVSRKMDKLLIDATHRSEMILVANELSNLNIQIQGYYIDHGHSRNEEERQHLRQAWQEMQPLPKRVESIGTFFEKVNRFQAHMWLNYIRLDLYAARENAAEWVILFRLYPQMREKDPDLYMRGLYYLLLFCFLLDDLYSFSRYLEEFSTFAADRADTFMPASNLLAFQYLSLSKLNLHLLANDYQQAEVTMQEIREGLVKYKDRIDEHRSMLFYYKFAYIYFAQGDYNAALDILDDMLQTRSSFLREDIHYNAHLLELICRYQLEQFMLLDYRLTALQRLLKKGRDVSRLQRLGVTILRKVISKPASERKEVFRNYMPDLQQLKDDPYERKALKYLDLPLWVSSLLVDQTLQQTAMQTMRTTNSWPG
jgi:hypothetical protein